METRHPVWLWWQPQEIDLDDIINTDNYEHVHGDIEPAYDSEVNNEEVEHIEDIADVVDIVQDYLEDIVADNQDWGNTATYNHVSVHVYNDKSSQRWHVWEIYRNMSVPDILERSSNCSC